MSNIHRVYGHMMKGKGMEENVRAVFREKQVR